MTHRHQKILVTGGAGFGGSHLVDRLHACIHFIKGDIRDFNLVKESMKDIDAVFHEAALASVTLSVKMHACRKH